MGDIHDRLRVEVGRLDDPTAAPTRPTREQVREAVRWVGTHVSGSPFDDRFAAALHERLLAGEGTPGLLAHAESAPPPDSGRDVPVAIERGHDDVAALQKFGVDVDVSDGDVGLGDDLAKGSHTRLCNPMTRVAGEGTAQPELIMCCLCFEMVPKDRLHLLPSGAREDVCVTCAEHERASGEGTAPPPADPEWEVYRGYGVRHKDGARAWCYTAGQEQHPRLAHLMAAMLNAQIPGGTAPQPAGLATDVELMLRRMDEWDAADGLQTSPEKLREMADAMHEAQQIVRDRLAERGTAPQPAEEHGDG